MFAYSFSLAVKLFEAYAIGLPFCHREQPNPFERRRFLAQGAPWGQSNPELVHS
ncbi:hypothetical protein DPMN_177755 [Dreissena polymorpha]|uniref:Uncharacterized protein n=1 Tax=Dreissena polymorpha TaxID=45954 RepID=A0A9D4EAV6_DREPO|nr:hypothetical protein DPMN_177731 [Dreissena polymorpha]KAH3776333.1 hypothetical protein DPMN_177755 [Dreissena polymorpha]